MRPVNRGEWPLGLDGRQRVWKDYKDARGELIARLHDYCSFCELPLGAGLAVEHVLPKSRHKDLKFSWENFLLACVNCNSIKGDEDLVLGDYFWPDRDDTFAIFAYREGGVIRVADHLLGDERKRALDTILLTGLDRRPRAASASDRRWLKRLDAWTNATEALRELKETEHGQPDERRRRGVVREAVATGFWSVWMTVFAADRDMQERLINAFRGTRYALLAGPVCAPASAHPKKALRRTAPAGER